MFNNLRQFIKLESAGGILLFTAAILALIIDNSPYSYLYNHLLNTPVSIDLKMTDFSLSLTSLMNEVLMTLFFLLVGLEIKREILCGELNSKAKAFLPAIAALGGMVAPIIIYLSINGSDPALIRGWAIPCATDIAFALGVLSLLGRRVPSSLKVFLTALAIFDDLGAVIIIAIFYAQKIAWVFLSLTLLCFLLLLLFNFLRVRRLFPYMVMGVALWLCIIKSGIHPSITGVLLAVTIPLRNNSSEESPAQRLERGLHPWVVYGILPLFGFVNAGISVAEVGFNHLFTRLSLGIAVALFAGKQIGIFGASWLAVKTKIAALPEGADWLSLYGVATICGIGFTMSLFIGGLAFGQNNTYEILVHMGVICGSLFSGILGYLLLRLTHQNNTNKLTDQHDQ